MKWRPLAALAVALIAVAGCGPDSKVANTPSDEQIKADQAQQKQIEAEERGNPVKGKKK